MRQQASISTASKRRGASKPAWRAEFYRLGELLRKARENAGLTHLELSQRSGIRKGNLRHAESGGHWSRSLVEGIVVGLPPSSELANLIQLWDQFSIKGSIKKLSKSPEFRDRFPSLLREARENAGLSVRELARRAGIDAAYLSKMERNLVPPPKWPKIAAIAGHLPLSELAKQAEVSGKEKLKHSVLEQVGEVEKLIVSLPGAAFDDEIWISEIQARLRKCSVLVKASGDAAEMSQPLWVKKSIEDSEQWTTQSTQPGKS